MTFEVILNKGLKGKDMDYSGKYAIQRRTNQWKALRSFSKRADVDKNTQIGYEIADFLHNFNKN